MKIKKKDKVESVPKFNSHSGFSRENWNKLNSGEVVDQQSQVNLLQTLQKYILAIKTQLQRLQQLDYIMIRLENCLKVYYIMLLILMILSR